MVATDEFPSSIIFIKKQPDTIIGETQFLVAFKQSLCEASLCKASRTWANSNYVKIMAQYAYEFFTCLGRWLRLAANFPRTPCLGWCLLKLLAEHESKPAWPNRLSD